MSEDGRKLRPIERDSLGQRAYWELRQALAEGRYRSGERLRLRDLAEEMGTSVTPVREAVLQLVHEGALHLQTPRDIRVRSLSADEYREVVAIRKFLEGEVLERFLEVGAATGLEALEGFEVRLQEALARHDYRTAVSVDRRCMFAIFEAAGMPLFVEILDRLWLLARPTVSLLYSEPGAAAVDLSNQNLLNAIGDGDVAAVKAVRAEQIDRCAEVILAMLEREATDDVAVGS